MQKAAWSVAEYIAFMMKRWRFIAAGTIVTVGMMAAITASRPKTYSTWAVIDAGSLGERKGLDYYRNGFNAGDYVRHLKDPAAVGVTKAWLLYARPKLMLRVDADNPRGAVTGANALIAAIMADLSQVPVPPSPAPPDEARAVEQLIADLVSLTADRLSRARADADRLRREHRKLIEDFRARAPSSQDAAVSPAEARKIIVTSGAWSDALRELDRLAVASATATQLRNIVIPAGTVAALGGIAPLPNSNDDLVRRVDALAAVVAKMSVPGADVRPALVTSSPEPPSVPSWPNVPLNLLIAFIFGAVGSTFAAMLRSTD
jgi:hypothetical protein